jgi:uncharacterized membrane protein/thiol-disulfide isomerase/thioredoxin
MMCHWRLIILFFAGLLMCAGAQPVQAQTPSPGGVARAVLFYSPSCGHCEYVITEVLPPLFEQYGDQLQIVGVDVTQPAGQAMFWAALEYFGLESSGVPFLVVGDQYLVGSRDIPEILPGLIERHLAQGGLDWPAIPGLAEALAGDQPAEATAAEPPTEIAPTLAASSTPASPESTPGAAAVPPPALATPTPALLLAGGLGAKFGRDLVGNSLAVVVLAGMLLSLGWAGLFLQRKPGARPPWSWGWAIPLLCLLGLGVAGYLAYVEMNQVQAVCGPVGDCNSVQQSRYARLFGVIPIGLLGLAGYLAILLAWLVGRWSRGRLASLAWAALWAMTAFGVVFSIYLTFLEPFVIGATCAWCLTSAILMTGLFLCARTPGRAALISLRSG